MICGMDWLFTHKTMIHTYKKDIECLDDDAENKIFHGKTKPTSVRMVRTMQAKHIYRKWCVSFVVHIFSDKGNDFEDDEVLKRYLVVQLFEDVFQA